jgi:hypothetical protein
VFPVLRGYHPKELTGLAVWGAHLARLMLGRPGLDGGPAAAEPLTVLDPTEVKPAPKPEPAHAGCSCCEERGA